MDSTKNHGVSFYAVLFCAVSLCMQGQAPTATVWGTITDTSGAAIADAAVQVNNSQTGSVQNTVSNTETRYRIPNLPIGSSAFDLRHTLRINGVYVLPFKGKKLVESWQLCGIPAWQTGVPISVTNGWDQMGDGTMTRPDFNPNCTDLVLGTAAHWFNPACFSAPPAGVPGNLLRTVVPGPDLVNTDFSLAKDTGIPKSSEAFNIQFRAEFFDIFNHTNFGYPTGGVFTQGAVIKSSADTPLSFQSNVSSSAGQITAILGTARRIQLGLKILF